MEDIQDQPGNPEGQDPATYAGPEGPRPAEDTPPAQVPDEEDDSTPDDDNEE